MVEMRPEALQATLERLVRKHRVPGAQLALHQAGTTIAVQAGEHEHRSGRPIEECAAVPIGSVTKAFTASLVMVLVADGDLELGAPVREYLPELAGLGDRHTVARLLSHTAGLPAEAGSEAQTASLRRYVSANCRPESLLQPPGIGFSYSNVGYVLLGRLVETITGMSWAEALASILLEPLGIVPAFVDGPTPARPVVPGHSVNSAAGRIRPVLQSVVPAEAAAGGLAVSATDLVRLALLHVPPGVPALLPSAEAARMQQADPLAEPFGVADGWGLGLAVYRHGSAVWLGHDGNGDGTACYFRVAPAHGLVLALTANSNTGYGLWLELQDEFGAAGIPIGRHRARMSTHSVPVPPACIGIYTNGDTEYVIGAGEDGRLRFAVAGDLLTGITCHDDLTFTVPDPAAAHQSVVGRFLRDRFTGAVTGMQLGGRLIRRHSAPSHGVERRLTA